MRGRSTLTGCRALRAAPQGRDVAAQSSRVRSGSGGIRTLSISRSEREWSAGCLPSLHRKRRKPWDSNPQAARGRLLFSRQVPHPAGWLPFVFACRRVPGAGIEPAASTFRAWRHDQPQLPRSVPRLLFGQNTFRSVQVREGGFEPPPPESKSGSLPVSRFPRVPRGS